MEGRHNLDNHEKEVLQSLKTQLDVHISYLLERGVRPANIEIELVTHIKKVLKGE